MRFILIILLFLAAGTNYAQKSKNRSTKPSKLQIALRIYNQLLTAAGTNPNKAPVLRFAEENVKIAGYHSKKNYIRIDSLAFDICVKQKDGTAALAWVLGHELAHYNHGHGDCAKGFADKINETHECQFREEEQADYVGAFYAFLAGFDMTNVADKLLDDLYAAYTLKDKDLAPVYRPKNERKKSARQAVKLATELWTIYETAGWLTAAGRFNLAQDYYRHLVEYADSPELRNNIGLGYILHKLSTQKREINQYFFPFELDPNHRISGIIHRDDNSQRLASAEAELKVAIEMNEQYFPANLNLLCLYIVSGNPKKALDKWAGIYAKFQSPRERALLLIAKGIANAVYGQTVQAKEDFETAKNTLKGLKYPHISDIIKHNLRVLEDKKTDELKPITGINSGVETLPTIHFEDFNQNEKIWIDTNSPGSKSSFNFRESERGLEAFHMEQTMINWFKIWKVDSKNEYFKTEIGTNRKQIFKKYPNATFLLINNGLYINAGQNGLVFKIEGDEVSEQITFEFGN